MKKLELNKAGGKVLITGGAGFLGSAIIDQLIERDYKVVALVRRSSLSRHLDHPQVKKVFADVRDSKAIAGEMKSCDAVIHAAATFAGDWDHFYQVNVASCEALIKQALKHDVRRFVYISSVSVYRHAGISGETVYTEEMPFEDDDATVFYSKSKIEAEKVIQEAMAKHQLPAVILRPGAIYGPRGHIFPATMGLGLGDERIILMGDSSSNLPLSYVENVADIAVRSLEQPDAVGEVFNLTEDETLTRADYARQIQQSANPDLAVMKFPMWFMRTLKATLKFGFGLIGRNAPLAALNLEMYATTLVYANDKVKKVFGEKPLVGFSESIQRTMAWHKSRLTPHRAEGLKGFEVIVPSVRKLNVGLVGCGNIAHAHLKFLTQIENVGNLFVADPSEEARKSVCDKFPIAKDYGDYQDMVKSENLDVVHILTPPQYHFEIGAFAARQGCHMLVEKPMTVNGEEAEKLIAVAEENQIKLCVMHNHLYDKVMIQARELLAKGALGRVTYVESWYGTQFGNFEPPYASGYWGYGLPGSLFQDFLPHALYVAADLLGPCEVDDVAAGYCGGVQGVEYDELKIRLKKGDVTGLVSVSMSVSPRYQFVNIYGTTGTLKIDLLNKSIFLDKQIGPVPKSINRIISSFKAGAAHFGAGFRGALKLNKVEESIFEGSNRQIQLFYRSILLDRPEPVTGTEGHEIMALMDRIWEKMSLARQPARSTRLRA